LNKNEFCNEKEKILTFMLTYTEIMRFESRDTGMKMLFIHIF